MPQSHRSFVARHTAVVTVPGLAGIRLHLAEEALPLWHAVQVETGDPDTPLPYWGFAWGGGLAIARYLVEHPERVTGRTVLDLGSGSGLCAIVAAKAGARAVTAIDIDPFAAAAIGLNARLNAVRITVLVRDVLGDEPPDAEVVLAGDCWYEGGLAERVMPWLQIAGAGGGDVLVGDPGRRYLPADALTELAMYEVRTTTELEDMDRKRASVYELRPGRTAANAS